MDPNPENVRQDTGTADGDASGGDGVVGSLLPAAYPSSPTTSSPSSMTVIMRRMLGAEGGRGTECKQHRSSCGRSMHIGISCPTNRHSVHISHPPTASLSVAPSHDVADTATVQADGCKQPGRGTNDGIETVVATTSPLLPILERCGAGKAKSTPRDDYVAFRETDATREGRAASCFRLTACTDTTGRVILRSRVTAETNSLAMRREGSNGRAILNSSRLTHSGLTRFPRGGIGPPSAVGPNRRINSRMVILGSSTDSPQGDRERDTSLVPNQAGCSGQVDAMAWGDRVVDSRKRPRWGALEDPSRGRSDRDTSLESGSDYSDTDDEDDSCPTLPTSLASPWQGDSGGGSHSCDSTGGGPSRTVRVQSCKEA